MFWRSILSLVLAGLAASTRPARAEAIPSVLLARPMPPPTWALLERELFKANAIATEAFYDRYFDERGYLLCVERWGGDDGPDDAIEAVTDWTLLHALGGGDGILQRYHQAWEGHLRQYTEAKTVEVPLARDGMYYQEFPVMFDWLHHAEGLTPFSLQGLATPDDSLYRRRVQRFAGFYLNESPQAQNYDFEHRIIRSLFTGSRGPLLRRATALDWAGDPIEVAHRFQLGHGERSYQEMLAHFEDYNEIVGDHPSNLLATSLAVHAYALTGNPKYRTWLLDYVEAWIDRMNENNGIIPTNIGLDGTIGGEAGGRWYGGVYGWGFTVRVPQTGAWAHRQTHHLGFIGFMNAYLLTGDDRYLEPWRVQSQRINAEVRMIDGVPHYPQKYGDRGWYHFTPAPYRPFARELHSLSWEARDRVAVADDPWLRYLDGDHPNYPETVLRADLNRIRQQVEGMRKDHTTPDTRLADDPMKYNPASVQSLVSLTLGGLHPGRLAAPLHCRVRYFDPQERRAGLPSDVAALVSKIDPDGIQLTLVNISQTESRTVILQSGAYGEHRWQRALTSQATQSIQGTHLQVTLQPGAGDVIQLEMERFVNPPTLEFPWQSTR